MGYLGGLHHTRGKKKGGGEAGLPYREYIRGESHSTNVTKILLCFRCIVLSLPYVFGAFGIGRSGCLVVWTMAFPFTDDNLIEELTQADDVSAVIAKFQGHHHRYVQDVVDVRVSGARQGLFPPPLYADPEDARISPSSIREVVSKGNAKGRKARRGVLPPPSPIKKDPESEEALTAQTAPAPTETRRVAPTDHVDTPPLSSAPLEPCMVGSAAVAPKAAPVPSVPPVRSAPVCSPAIESPVKSSRAVCPQRTPNRSKGNDAANRPPFIAGSSTPTKKVDSSKNVTSADTSKLSAASRSAAPSFQPFAEEMRGKKSRLKEYERLANTPPPSPRTREWRRFASVAVAS